MPSGTTSDHTSTDKPTVVTNSDGPAFNTRSQTCQCLSMDTSTAPPDVMPDISIASDPTPKLLMADKLEALLQMQKTDHFL